jgi:hypothetical protein
MAGPVVGSPAAAVSKPFKQPFKAVAQLSHKTGSLTKPIDPAISKTLDFVYNGYTVRVLSCRVVGLCPGLCPSGRRRRRAVGWLGSSRL